MLVYSDPDTLLASLHSLVPLALTLPVCFCFISTGPNGAASSSGGGLSQDETAVQCVGTSGQSPVETGWIASEDMSAVEEGGTGTVTDEDPGTAKEDVDTSTSEGLAAAAEGTASEQEEESTEGFSEHLEHPLNDCW